MLKIAWTAVFVFLSLLQTPGYASNTLEVTLQVFYDSGPYANTYYKPLRNIIKIRDDGPVRPFRVVLTNISSKTKRVRFDLTSQGLDQITFEISDDSGNKNVVKKRSIPQNPWFTDISISLPENLRILRST